MAGGKETPRQKMIGMMYLVLLAMLAMNVSKEVLDSFILINDALDKTNSNFEAKNESSYAEFSNQMMVNADKVREWNNKAQRVKELSNEMDNYIQDLKQKVIYETQGYGSDYPEISEVPDSLWNIKNFKTKDNYDIPSRILIGDAGNLKEGEFTATEFHAKLQSFKDEVNSILGARGQEAVRIGIEFDEVKQPDGTMQSWEAGNFYHLPVAAVVTNFTRFQANVRNTEADVLNYLLSNIGKTDFKFNKLEVKVIQPGYVVQGDSFRAEVFVAATDTTQDPLFEVGTKFDTSGGEFKITEAAPAENISVEDGKGIYKFKASNTGEFTWGGVLKVKKPGSTDEYVEYTFDETFIVASPSLTVSPSAMNVFYRGLKNPVQVAVSGIADSKLKVSMTNGTITKAPDGNGYIAQPGAGLESEIKVMAEMADGSTKDFGASKFRVKKVPNPVGMFAGIKGTGKAPLAQLKANDKVYALLEDFVFDGVRFQVTGFELSGLVNGEFRNARSNSAKVTGPMSNIIGAQVRGGKIFVENIKAVGPDGDERNIGGVTITITG